MTSTADSGSRLTVVGIHIGRTVSQAIASSIVSSAIASPAIVGEAVVEGAAVSSAAQAEALGLLVLRLPLRDAEKLRGFVAAVEAYLAANKSVLTKVAEMSSHEQMMTVGVRGSLIGAIAAATVQQSVLTAKFVWGTMPASAPSYIYQSTTIALSVVAGVGGGAAGAVVGTLLIPGMGTSLGSLVGSFTASFLPYSLRQSAPTDNAEEPWNPSRPLRVTESPLEGWLEVADERTSVTFAQHWDDAGGGADATSADRDEVWRTAMAEPVAADEVLVFLSQKLLFSDSCVLVHQSTT